MQSVLQASLGSSCFAPFVARSLSLQASFHTLHVPSSGLLGCTFMSISETRFPTSSLSSDISVLSCRMVVILKLLLHPFIPSSKVAENQGEGECEAITFRRGRFSVEMLLPSDLLLLLSCLSLLLLSLLLLLFLSSSRFCRLGHRASFSCLDPNSASQLAWGSTQRLLSGAPSSCPWSCA